MYRLRGSVHKRLCPIEKILHFPPHLLNLQWNPPVQLTQLVKQWLLGHICQLHKNKLMQKIKCIGQLLKRIGCLGLPRNWFSADSLAHDKAAARLPASSAAAYSILLCSFLMISDHRLAVVLAHMICFLLASILATSETMPNIQLYLISTRLFHPLPPDLSPYLHCILSYVSLSLSLLYIHISLSLSAAPLVLTGTSPLPSEHL